MKPKKPFCSPFFWLVAIFSLLVSGCGYNEIQRNEEMVFAAWGDVEATYQRRADLIPNLVETVKAYAAHEKETLQALTEARSRVGQVQISAQNLGDAAAVQKYVDAQGAMSSALSRLLAIAEAYPDLKASQNFRDLQHQLEGTENRINVARQRYNEAVQEFNSSIRSFPNNLTNKFLLRLPRKEPFKAQAGAEQAPKVRF
ncbi:MAG: LemA family protein [Deltaproteobacteria bacterium]|nr:LemA family protein [Deltaproteobacteria bacterium]